MEQGTRKQQHPELDQLPPAKFSHISRGIVCDHDNKDKCDHDSKEKHEHESSDVRESGHSARLARAPRNKSYLTRKSARSVILESNNNNIISV